MQSFRYPTPAGDLTWARASYESVYGRIRSGWLREGGRLALDVTIPQNTTATDYVPAGNAASVTEGGQPLDRAAGVKLLREEGGCVVLAVESGAYRFLVDPFTQYSGRKERDGFLAALKPL